MNLCLISYLKCCKPSEYVYKHLHEHLYEHLHEYLYEHSLALVRSESGIPGARKGIREGLRKGIRKGILRCIRKRIS